MGYMKEYALPKLMQPDRWEALSGKERWDAITGLRGPDMEPSQRLKWITASVIRHHLKDVMRVGGLVNNFMTCIIVPRASEFEIYEGFNYRHYIGHITDSAAVLQIPVFHLRSQTGINWSAEALSGSFHNKLCKALETDSQAGFFTIAVESSDFLLHLDRLKKVVL